MNGVGFEILARTPVPKLPLKVTPPPPPPTPTPEPVGHVYSRPELPPLFKEHKVCSFDSGNGSCMLYVTTLKEFNHT